MGYGCHLSCPFGLSSDYKQKDDFYFLELHSYFIRYINNLYSSQFYCIDLLNAIVLCSKIKLNTLALFI